MIDVAVIGASGLVGQKALALIGCDAQCRVIEIAASLEKRRKRYGDVVEWMEELEKPDGLDAMRLIDVEEVSAPYVISALPAEIAREVEYKLAKRGQHVFSNASAWRMDENVPILVPEINLHHLELTEKQPTIGKIVTNPNCVAIFVALVLAPLRELGIINHVGVVTMQAASGAGIPGMCALDLIGNVLPDIPGEAEKIEKETKKILGTLDSPAPFSMMVHTHRVPVMHGHLATLHVHFEEAVSAEAAFNLLQSKGVPYIHSPLQPRKLKPDDHQVHFGNVIQGSAPHIVGLQVLGHNLVRGAAGATLHNLQTFLEAKAISVS